MQNTVDQHHRIPAFACHAPARHRIACAYVEFLRRHSTTYGSDIFGTYTTISRQPGSLFSVGILHNME